MFINAARRDENKEVPQYWTANTGNRPKSHRYCSGINNQAYSK